MPQYLPLALVVFMTWMSAMSQASEAVPHVVLAIHGGTSGAQPGEWEAETRADMKRALEAGYVELQKEGSSALDAVEAAVRVLEDSPHFNAGKGSVFNLAGQIEMDASIMEGAEKRGGAVSNVTILRNPISAARAVMEQTPHVLLAGRGAEVFAAQQGVETVDPSYFWTERRWKQLEEAWQRQKAKDDRTSDLSPPEKRKAEWGTVGAVAVDREGNLAAATSTGGRSGKMPGRVGDSPILGAGTYADNVSCAVSGTGEGEYFIRLVVAHEVAALVKYRRMTIDKAATAVIEQLTESGGVGGVIALDPQGNFAAPFNTPGMHRGYITSAGEATVLLYGESNP